MLSAEDFAAIRIAVELCNNNELKREVLCAPCSEYDRNLSRYDTYRDREAKWKEILENKTPIILEELGLPRALLEKVTSLVILIGRKMLTWAKYHEGILGLSREHSTKFLNSSFLTSHGIIDNKKASEELVKDSSLSIKQRYKLACLYCLKEHIPDLHRQMSLEENDNDDRGLNYPEIVTFWSDYLMGKIDKLRGEKTMDQYMLEKAIESGSKAAVEYCLEKTSLSSEKDVVIDAALKTIRKTPQICHFYDWRIFTECRQVLHVIPIHHFVDILCFLLSKMSEEQKTQFLKKDVEDSRNSHLLHPGSRVLNCFLNWQYQNNFMKTAKLMWEFLPERTYVALLLNICDKISPRVFSPEFREDKSYDCRKLLKEFWIHSPDHYKRYVFSEKETIYFNNTNGILNVYKNLLIVKLFALKNDTYEDREIFELILDSTTGEEKERIVFSEKGKDICIRLMEGQKWKMVDEFLSKCISSKEEVRKFKRRLSFTDEALSVCAYFIPFKWDAAEFFIKWSSLSQEDIIRFKREMIYSEHGRYACRYLFLHKGGEIANKFCEWCFSSEKEIRKFKKELIFSVGVESCADLITEDKLDVVDEFINWSHLSQSGIRAFKKHLQHEKGNYICENLITGDVTRRISNAIWYMFDRTIQFRGGKWEHVEKFLTWCCSSEEEIRDFKKERLLKISGAEIHFCLIESSRWEEAETFFAWLGLSPEEVKELKKETLFNHKRTKGLIRLLMCRRRDNEELSDYESRQEGIELFLRWHMTDKETVLEFRDHFKQKYERPEMNEEYRAILKIFDSAIEQRLSELDEEQRGFSNVELKRKRVDYHSMN